MDRHVWLTLLSEHSLPGWKCPVCKRGHTVLDGSSLVYKETAASARQHGDEAWDPEWVKYVFTAAQSSA